MSEITMNNQDKIVIYQTDDGQANIEVRLDEETIWLSQKQMGELFEKDSDTIGLHLKNIYKTGELEEISTTEIYSVIQKEGKRKVNRKIKFYNLDAIISIDELKRMVALQEKVISGYQLKTGEAEGLIYIISTYSKALSLLDDYDYQPLKKLLYCYIVTLLCLTI